MLKPRLRHFVATRIPSSPNPAYVGQPGRTFLIRQLHAALADPTERTSLPALPPKSAAREDSCAYWEAALYLTTYLLGWRNHAAGLVWFYERNLNPGGDALLALLREVWNSEGQLDLFAAWVCSSDFAVDAGPYLWTPGKNPLHPSAQEQMSTAWLADYSAKEGALVARHPHNPRTGGTNPLHLGHAFQAGAVDLDVVSWFSTSEDQRRATLLVDRMPGWYLGLAMAADGLPTSGDELWSVDVVAKPTGWLGTFTRSPTSGCWHATSEAVHLAGARGGQRGCGQCAVHSRTSRVDEEEERLKKRRHHYVWQHYLRAWTVDDQLWCARAGAVFRMYATLTN